MLVSATLKAPNTQKWRGNITRFEADLEYDAVKRAHRQISKIFFEHEKELFSTQGRSGKHGKWPDLSDAYAAWKRKHFGNLPIMVLRGHLVRSLTKVTSKTIKTASKSGSKWFFKYGTTLEYGLYHQKGIAGPHGSKTRRTIDPNDTMAREMIREIQREIVKAAKKTGGFDTAII